MIPKANGGRRTDEVPRCAFLWNRNASEEAQALELG